MENIYVLPTDKPSKLFISRLGNLVRCNSKLSIKSEIGYNVNIYITSNEEIKEGDWLLFQGFLTKALQGEKFSGNEKVVLTTDQDLIKDGVQAIDDDFLEWFVKNPSCESVKVEQEIFKLVHNPNYVNHTPEGGGIYLTPKSENLQYGETLIDGNVIDYKIIIPKEEAKQETLDEAAFNYVEKNHRPAGGIPDKGVQNYYDCKLSFTVGAKWQKERSYSEEEMKIAFTEGHDSARMKGSYKLNGTFEEDWNIWFEQIKKK